MQRNACRYVPKLCMHQWPQNVLLLVFHFYHLYTGKEKSVSGQQSIQSKFIPVCYSIKQLRVYLDPPGWNTSPLQGYPQH